MTPMLKLFELITFPTEMSPCWDIAALMLTTNSGAGPECHNGQAHHEAAQAGPQCQRGAAPDETLRSAKRSTRATPI